jgi:hypothetical protein
VRTHNRTTVLSQSRKSKLGYHIGEDDKFFISVELMNMHYSSQGVTLTAHWKFIEEPYSDYELGTPYWFDVASCGRSDVAATNNAIFAYSSPPVRLDFHGRMAYLSNHVHDGAVLHEVMKNGEIICSVQPQYSADDGVDGIAHLSHVPPCSNTGSIAPGDEVSLKASYNTVKYAPMINEDGSLEPVMGVTLVYIVKGTAPVGSGASGGFGLVISLAIIATAALVGGAGYVFYAAKQHKEWPKWFSRRQKYQSVGAEEGGFSDDYRLP